MLRDSETILDKYVMNYDGFISLTQPQLSLTWRLMHKATMRLFTLLERAPLYIFAFDHDSDNLREMFVGLDNRQARFLCGTLALQAPRLHSRWVTFNAVRWLREWARSRGEAVECLRRAEARK
jgi:hypothetical protein